MGKLMVIDGLDGCGKSTQLELLNTALSDRHIEYKQISFPDYAQPSSALVKMYLGGELGGSASAVNAYAASSFYAVDRYASYTRFWRADYEADKPIVAARYVTSNAIHQMTKLDRSEWDGYLEWLSDYEYNKLGLPKPNCVVFLDMPIEVSQRLLENRYHGDNTQKDIHERDIQYLLNCREAALFAARKQGWHVIACSDGNAPLPMEAIHQQILTLFEGMNG